MLDVLLMLRIESLRNVGIQRWRTCFPNLRNVEVRLTSIKFRSQSISHAWAEIDYKDLGSFDHYYRCCWRKSFDAEVLSRLIGSSCETRWRQRDAREERRLWQRTGIHHVWRDIVLFSMGSNLITSPVVLKVLVDRKRNDDVDQTLTEASFIYSN